MKNKIIIVGFLVAILIAGAYYVRIANKDHLPSQTTPKQTSVPDLFKTDDGEE